MKRVAVFGSVDGGKSTLARKIAAATALRLCPIDTIQLRPGRPVPRDRSVCA